MFTKALIVLATLCGAVAASAAPNLSAELLGPSGPYVYEMHRYEIVVTNSGRHRAKNVVAEIDLPETNTSPNVYIMGEVGDMHSKCVVAGTTAVCDFGRVRAGRTKTRWIEMEFPVSTKTIFLYATVTSSNAATTTAWEKPYLETFDTPISGALAVTNRHCTGQDLSSFFECETAPSSISSHQVVLEANGTITFQIANVPPGYTGSWSQTTDNHLTMTYACNGNPTMTFHGFGTGNGCFEGLTTFPNSSPYVSPYQVCPQ